MSLIRKIFDWAKTLPAWQQDAARRLFETPCGLTDQDFRELYALLLKEGGLGDCEAVPMPLDDSRIPDGAVGHSVVVKSLGNLQHVNRIDPSQRLEFLPTGMTIIYGSNGSGKSGYARVFKRACFCRDKGDAVLPNVAQEGEAEAVPSATFEIEYDRQKRSVEWHLGMSGDCGELANVSVFDSKTARLALTSEQELQYVPYGLGILTDMGTVVLPRLKEMIEDERKAIDLSEKAFETLRKGDTEVSRIFSDLYTADLKVIRTLGKLTDEEIARGKELKSILDKSDYAERISTTLLAVGRIQSVVGKITAANSKIGLGQQPVVEKLRLALQSAQKVEETAARELRGEESLIAGTGDAAWKVMFLAAKKFVAESCGDGSALAITGKCPLCQQPLAEDAVDRMGRFDEYVGNEIAKQIAVASAAVDAKLREINSIDISGILEGAQMSEFCGYDSSVSEIYKSWSESFERRRKDVCAVLTGDKTWSDVAEEDNRIVDVLQKVAKSLQDSVTTMQTVMKGANRDQVQKEIDELRARYKLQQILPQVEAWFTRLNRKNRLKEIGAGLGTLKLTQKIKELSESSVSRPLCQAVESEFGRVGMNLNLLRPALVARGKRGTMVGELALNVPNRQPISCVLSEGEQKAVAIASFLGELDVSGHKDAVVFDDPMTSLDHMRRRRIARRLAQEAKVRQVIIFSHEPVFVTRLNAECKAEKVDCKVLSLSRDGDLCGIVTPGMAWEHKGVKERMSILEQRQRALAKSCGDCPSPAEIRDIHVAYADLRSVIELVVQEVCLCGTIKRFEDYIQVSCLTRVPPLDVSAAEALVRLWGKCSDYFNGHDHASEANEGVPTPTELGEDIAELQDCINRIKVARKPKEGVLT